MEKFCVAKRNLYFEFSIVFNIHFGEMFEQEVQTIGLNREYTNLAYY